MAVVLIYLKTGKLVLSGLVLIVVIIIPTLMLLFKEPLENLFWADHICPIERHLLCRSGL